MQYTRLTRGYVGSDADYYSMSEFKTYKKKIIKTKLLKKIKLCKLRVSNGFCNHLIILSSHQNKKGGWEQSTNLLM